MADELILINVSGQDKPGLMSLLIATLSQSGAHILDIGHAVIHEDLALGILVTVDSAAAGAMIKDIMFDANEAGSSDAEDASGDESSSKNSPE